MQSMCAKTDLMLYSLAIVTGVLVIPISSISIVDSSPSMVDTYMNNIITRMDNMNELLSRWESQDIRQDALR